MKRLEGFLTYLFTGIGIGAVVCTVSLAVMGGMDGTLKQILVWLFPILCVWILAIC